MSTLTFRAIPALAGQTVAHPLELRGIAWPTITLFLAGSVLAGGIYAANAGYARKETAVGHLTPAAGASRISSPQPGILAHVDVAAGQRVEAGQALFTLDTRHSLEGGGTLDATLRQALDQQTALLQEQIAAEESRARADEARLHSRISGLEAELASLAIQRGLQVERTTVTEERLKALSALRGKGYVSEAEYRAREEAWLAQRQDLAALDQRTTALEVEIAQTRIEQEQLPAETADRLARLRSTLADVRQRQAEVAAQGARVVRAPVAGRVTALQAAAGQRVDATKPILTIIPEGSALRADLFVPSRAIGFVEPGQRVRLMYDAFPFQRFGSYGGVVETVSETVLSAEEIIGSVRPNEPSYRVSVRLDRETVDAFGKAVMLQPDMTVTADLILEERTLFEWLLEPILSARGRM